MLAWTTFAFAGRYASSLAVPGLMCIVLAGALRPWNYFGQPVPALDKCLVALVTGVATQLIPLPAFLVDLISPADRPVWRQLVLVMPSSVPLTIDIKKTAAALLTVTGVVLIFLVARRLFSTGGVRIVARGVALIGALLSAIALAQNATAHGLVYWRWKLISEGPPPFGPFINRNHFATWVVIAVPLCVGYLAAHVAAHERARSESVVVLRRWELFDGRTVGLTGSACLMLVALIVTLSRSGMMGMAAAALAGLALRGRRQDEGGTALRWIVGAGAAAGALILAEVNLQTIGTRLGSVHVALSDRLVIWHDTVRILRDFPLTGTGAGTFETAMLVYQRSSPGVLFNTAHNHYLQVMAEGGLLLGIPVFLGLALFARSAWQALSRDESGMYWVRAGALCGLVGAAVQSLWETGLTMPANAVLAAIVAAVAVHDTTARARH